MDIKDIMGIKGDTKGAAKKTKGVSEKKPEGVSREVWQITKGQSGDALAPVVPTHAGLKDKRKVSARKVAWSWQPFKNSARGDQLMLKHWVKTGAGGAVLPGSNGGDVGGDYAFSKYNKKVDMLAYNDEEYGSLLAQLTNGDWSREETDHLFELLQRFDLRFLVAHDRWEHKGTKNRSVEEMKARYYEIARALLEARADVPEEAAAHPLLKDPFNADAERDRKLALADQMERTNALEREEQNILDEVKAIGAGGAPRRGSRRARARRFRAPAGGVRGDASLEDLPEEQRAGCSRAANTRCRCRSAGAHLAAGRRAGPRRRRPPSWRQARTAGGVVEVAAQMAAAAVGTGGARGVKRIESLVEELGVKPPQVSTRAVCEAWLELRGGDGAARAAQAARPAQEGLRHHRGVRRAAAAARGCRRGGVPGGWSAGHAPREAVRGAPGPGRAAHRHPSGEARQKRKMPARFADDDAPPSPPRRSAEKRQKR